MKRTPSRISAEKTTFFLTFGLVLILMAVYAVGFLGLAAGLPIGKWEFPLAIVLALGTGYFCTRGLLTGRSQIKLAVILLASILLSGVASWLILDTSWDGQWYHLLAIFKLGEGWNPIHTPFYPPDRYDQSSYIWIQHYPKYSWISAAVIYKCTGYIETGKLINQLILLATFFNSYYVLGFFIGKKGWRFFMSLLVALNPVVFTQLFTDYVDGIMGSFLLLILLQLIALELETSGWQKLQWAMLGCCIIMASNLKFTGLILSAILIVFFSIYWLIQRKTIKILAKKAVGFTLFYCLAFFVFGYNPYLTNYQAKKFPFYPVNDPQLYDVIMNSVPKLIKTKKNTVEKLGISLLSESNNDAGTTLFHWKSPFAVHKSEILLFSTTDVRLGGFGPLFQLTLWLTIILFVYNLIKHRKRPFFYLVLTCIVCILGAALVFSESWWARYFSILYLFPFLVMLTGAEGPGSLSSGMPVLSRSAMPVLSKMILLVLALNFILIGTASLGANVIKTRLIRQEMESIKNPRTPVRINFNGSYFQATRRRLWEAGVPFIETDTLTGKVRELHTLYKLEGFGPRYSLSQ